MNKNLTWLPFYTGDYLKYTRGFTIEEKGIYIEIFSLLIDMPVDPITETDKILRIFSEEKKQTVILVLERLKENNFWDFFKELKNKQLGKKKNNSENGKKGGRPRKPNGYENKSISESESESESNINNSIKQNNDNPVKEYKWKGNTIKLTEKDYEKWKKSFKNIDIDAELQALDDFYTSQNVADWFIRCSKALANANRKSDKITPLALKEPMKAPNGVDFVKAMSQGKSLVEVYSEITAKQGN